MEKNRQLKGGPPRTAGRGPQANAVTPTRYHEGRIPPVGGWQAKPGEGLTRGLLATILLLLVAMVTMGQTTTSGVTPPYDPVETPTVASFIKNIDHPVGLYHGNPEISHTLYTLKDGDITLPVNLNYNASGIKVSEEASWVGLGWNLNMGGMVVQQAVGETWCDTWSLSPDGMPETMNLENLYDENTVFNYYMPIPCTGKYISMADDAHDYLTFYNSYGPTGRLQPDVFYFVFPGGSGKFYIDDRDNTVHLLNKTNNIKIEQISDNLNDGWKITTADGACHTFNVGGGSYSSYNPFGRSFVFYLASSDYPNGQHVTYNYTFNEIRTCSPVEKQKIILQVPRNDENESINDIPSSETSGYVDKFANDITEREGTLSSITTTNYIITFNATAREDLYNGVKLDEVKITPNNSAYGNVSKDFKFTYDYFISGNGVATNNSNTWGIPDTNTLACAGKRLKLLGVYETDAGGNKNDMLSFDYDESVGLPQKNSLAVDYWGYYNGETSNTSLIPDFNYLLTDQYRNLPWLTKPYAQMSTSIRAYNDSTCGADMLKRVNYPEGGYMEYTYEPHQYKAPNGVFIPTVDELGYINTAGSATVSATSMNSPAYNNVATIHVDKGDRVDINITEYRVNSTWTEMNGSGYKLEFMPDGGDTYTTITNSQVGPNAASTDDTFKQTPSATSTGGTYRLTVYLPPDMPNQNGADTNHSSITGTMTAPRPAVAYNPHVGYNYGGGVRVNKVTYHDGLSTAKDYTLSYSYPSPDSLAVSFVPLMFHRQFNNLTYAQIIYGMPLPGQASTTPNGTAPIGVVVGYNGSELELSGANFCSSPYSTVGESVGYSSVVETRSYGGGSTYRFTNKDDMSMATAASYFTPYPMNGTLEAAEHYDTDGKEVAREEYVYNSTLDHFYWGITMDDYFNRSPEFYPDLIRYGRELNGGFSLVDFGAYDGRYQTLAYALPSYKTLLTRKASMANGVTTIHDYTYDDNMQVTKDNETRSDGTTQATTYTYPYDYNVAPYTDMTIKHMLAYPVEVKQSVNGVDVGSKLTQYLNFGNTQLPYSTLTGIYPNNVAGNSTYTNSGVADKTVYPYVDATFHHYDSYGNPTNLTGHGDEVVLIWGYGGQYPVAEIKNSSYSAVCSALGMSVEDHSNILVPDMNELNGLRALLPNAQITTYEYKPLVGLTKMTAPDGTSATYEYDSFGRLTDTRDNDGNVIMAHDYHYAGSHNPSTLPDTGTPITPPTPPQPTNIIGNLVWNTSQGHGSASLGFSRPTTGALVFDIDMMTSSGNHSYVTLNVPANHISASSGDIILALPTTQVVSVAYTMRKLDDSDPSTYTILVYKQGTPPPPYINIDGKVTWAKIAGGIDYSILLSQPTTSDVMYSFDMKLSDGSFVTDTVYFAKGSLGVSDVIYMSPNPDLQITSMSGSTVAHSLTGDTTTSYYMTTTEGTASTMPPVAANITGTLRWNTTPGHLGYSIIFSKPITGNIAVDIRMILSPGGGAMTWPLNFSNGISGAFNRSVAMPSSNMQVSTIDSFTVRKLDSSDPSTYTVTVVKQ